MYPERDTSAVTAGNIISLFADSINFGEGDGRARDLSNVLPARIAGASKRFRFVSNAADQNHNLRPIRARGRHSDGSLVAGDHRVRFIRALLHGRGRSV